MKFKRFLALLLVMVSVLGMLPAVTVSADETTEETGTEEVITEETGTEETVTEESEEAAPAGTANEFCSSGVVANPLYGDALNASSASFAEHTDADAEANTTEVTYLSLANAGAQFRQYMVDRDTYFYVYVQSTNSDWYAIYDSMWEAAMAHTGVPNEGDYISWHWEYYSWDAERYSSGGVYYYTYTIDLDYYTTYSQEAAVDSFVASLLNQLNVWNATDYQKVCAVYDWVCANITYDYYSSGMLKHTAYAGLLNGTCVCQGYASIMYRLLLELGVENRVVAGIAYDDPDAPHGWNIVKLGSVYYLLDATWDAGSSYYSWFLCSPYDFPDHDYYAYNWPEYATTAFQNAHPMAAESYDPSASNRTCVIAGNKATFTVYPNTSASYVTYQWQYRTGANAAWQNTTATGNKTNTLQVAATAAKSSYQYRCKITYSGPATYGGSVTYSRTMTMYVLGVKTQPANVTANAGTTAKFTVSASGLNKTYQWQYRTGPNGTWKNTTATGAKTANLSVAVTAAKNGYQYRCKITDAAGNSIFTNAATLTVNSGTVTITQQPTGQKVIAGKNATFTVKASGTGLTYQWQYRTSSTGSWINCTATGNKTATMKVPATCAKSGYQYRCKVSSGSNVKYTNVVYLYVLGIKTQPAGVVYGTAGANTKITIAATGHQKTFQWQYSTDGGVTWKNTTATGNKTATLTVVVTAAKNGYMYRCVVTDSVGNKVTSNTTVLIVQ